MGFRTDVCFFPMPSLWVRRVAFSVLLPNFEAPRTFENALTSALWTHSLHRLCVSKNGLYTWQHSFRHIINRSKNTRRIRPLENKRKLAWKDELRTMVAQDCFTCVSCPQAQLHLLVYFVFFVVKHDPDGMQHLPKLLHDCGCPSKLYSTCLTHVERKISQQNNLKDNTTESKAETQCGASQRWTWDWRIITTDKNL